MLEMPEYQCHKTVWALKIKDIERLINGTAIGSKTFTSLLENSGTLVSRAAKGELIIPDFESFSREIREVFEEVRGDTGGAVADYIPQLARVPADSFAVAITTIDGQQLSIGDVDNGFTLQSSCKPALFMYLQARVLRYLTRAPRRSYIIVATLTCVSAGSRLHLTVLSGQPPGPIADRSLGLLSGHEPS